MRTSFILLSGVAAIVTFGIAIATPVFAQYSGNPLPPQNADSPSPYGPIRQYDRDDNYPHAVIYRFGDTSLIRGDLVWNPALQLIAAPVLGSDGRWIGRIRVLQPGPDGSHADRFQIALGPRASVWVKAQRIQYDSDARVAFANLTREDVLRILDTGDEAGDRIMP